MPYKKKVSGKRENKKFKRNKRGGRRESREVIFDKDSWQPKTVLGKKVKSGEITDIDNILDSGLEIKEAEIVDALIPGLGVDLLLIGQAKGKFGGGQRRVFRQTQKKTSEGNKPKFATMVIAGDSNGHVGLGYGKSKETVPAREKAIRNAKLNMIKIRRGCGSWECGCKTAHSLPFAVEGKCGSATIKLMPAPKGTGLVVENECKKVLKLAGISDVRSIMIRRANNKINLIVACFNALRRLMEIKSKPEFKEMIGIVEGSIKNE